MAYLVKKIEQSHILWFEASNQWAQFDEQQWLIFCFYNDGVKQEKAVKELCKKFSFQIQAAQSFVDNIYFSLDNLFYPTFEKPDFSACAKVAASYKLGKTKSHLYLFNGKPFRIVYGSPWLESYIHLPLAHLETEDNKTDTYEIEVFPFENRFALRVNKGNSKTLTADEPGQIKRLLYIELTNFFYDKKESEWMAFLHGSALRKNNEIIILTSTGGSGKSTMAGLLMLNGFDFFSDDYIPVEAQSEKAYPFPAALCLKNDAISLLESKGLKLQATTKGKLAYAKPAQNRMQNQACKIRNVVFIKYCKEKDLVFEPISTLEALYHFLQEAWVGDNMKRAEQFLNWFTQLKFYKLVYGNNEKAIEKLGKLIEQG